MNNNDTTLQSNNLKSSVLSSLKNKKLQTNTLISCCTQSTMARNIPSLKPTLFIYACQIMKKISRTKNSKTRK